MATERIQKILARAGLGSRREAEDLLTAGLVTVNGTVARVGDSADAEVDSIKVDGKRVRPRASFRYVLVHKPTGVISTIEDPEGRPTVVEAVPAHLRKGLKPVGRLDFDTEGLIILTDDGDFAQQVAHPRYGSTKTYEVKIKGRLDEEALERLRRGMVIDGRRTGPIEVDMLRVSKVRKLPGVRRAPTADRQPNSWWTVVLREGRNRQIREMFFRVGHPVQRLRRVAIGSLTDRQLPRGGWRYLEAEEVEALRAKGDGAGSRTRRKPTGRAAAQSEPGAEASSPSTRRRGALRGPHGAKPKAPKVKTATSLEESGAGRAHGDGSAPARASGSRPALPGRKSNPRPPAGRGRGTGRAAEGGGRPGAGAAGGRGRGAGAPPAAAPPGRGGRGGAGPAPTGERGGGRPGGGSGRSGGGAPAGPRPRPRRSGPGGSKPRSGGGGRRGGAR